MLTPMIEVMDFGFRISDFGFRISDFGFRISDFGFRISDFGFRISVQVLINITNPTAQFQQLFQFYLSEFMTIFRYFSACIHACLFV